MWILEISTQNHIQHMAISDQSTNCRVWDSGNHGMCSDIVSDKSSDFTPLQRIGWLIGFNGWKVKYGFMKKILMSIAYVLLNSDLGSDESIIGEVKQILEKEDMTYEVQGVYGVYDIVLKLTSNNAEKLRAIITNKVRRISKVQSTLTMMVIEEQDNL